MVHPISRRVFLALTGGALAAPSISWSAAEVPTLLDHILLGCSDLDRGISFVEERTGVRAAFGGVHPGRGTQNALLSLGKLRYLEIIAPDPKQSGAEQFSAIIKLDPPRLIGWAAHRGNLGIFAGELGEEGVIFEGPAPGSRKRPDGRVLQWQTLSLKDDAAGMLPFFIEWSNDSLHPSADAPKGCLLLHFEAASPDPDELSRQVASLRLDLPVVKGERPQLRAIISGPKGQFSITS